MTEADSQDSRARGLEAWGDELVGAIREQPPRPRRGRLAAIAAAVLIAVPVGYAVADGLSGPESATDEPVLLEKGETVTLGYVDPKTDQPVLCPDGSLFTVTAGPDSRPASSTCSDGSVPALVTEYERKREAFLRDPPPEAYVGSAKGDGPVLSLEDAPQLPTFRVPPAE